MSSDPISKYDSSGVNYCTNHHDSYPFIAPSPHDVSLAGKYVVVTGASRGIGRAIAISLARAGASGIALLARSALPAAKADVMEAAKAAGHPASNVITVATDVTSKAQVEAAARTVSEAFDGKLDALILNAGALEQCKLIADHDADDWWFTYQINVLGTFLSLQHFIPLLRQTPNGMGTIISLASIGSTMTYPSISGCPTSKLAVTRLMEHINAEYGAKSAGGQTPLLAYSVHPGAIDHPERTDFPDMMHEMALDKPELAADTIAWLLKERRQWLAGRYVSANWE